MAARRERPDRPATSLRCTPEAWDAVATHLGVGDSGDVLDALDIDLRWVALPFIGPEDRTASPLGSEGVDFWGCRTRKVVNDFNTYFEFDYHPLESATSVKDVENHDWPSLEWWDYDAIPSQIKEASRGGERALMFFAGGAFETPWYIRGFEKFVMDLYDAPEMVDAICSRVKSYYLQRAERVIEAADGRIDIIGSGGDIGSQRGMLVSPEIWRRRIKPYTAGLITPFKERGLTTFYHSCGSLVPVIDDLIEVGLDLLDPVQVGAEGMEPEALARDFGDRLSFHGAIDEVELLPRATAEEVRRETTRIIDVLGARGGFVVSPSHQVQGDTAPENVVAVFEAAREYRWGSDATARPTREGR